MYRSLAALLIPLGLALPALAADTKAGPSPGVPLSFNRLYDYPELVEALKTLVAAHPDLLSMASLGKSVEGRDLWCVTINNRKTGPDRSKPAMYVDGNIHGNEVQAAEVSLYLIWYLTENYQKVENLRKLVDEKVFYIIPTVNPDGRAYWFNGPNTSWTSRSGKSPLDSDGDGLVDEDPFDDLDGDGHITQMRRRSPNGAYKALADDPRIMVPVKPGEQGEFDVLDEEGIDNDGDGQVNEDPPGGYDMNRNWPADWQPGHVQFGAGDYPLCWPETRAIAQFFLDHPNIAGVQAFHNSGGQILRGPGSATRKSHYPAEDDRIAEAIAAVGVKILPHYRSFVIHRDLYEVHGGFIGWTYEHLGIFSYTNELWTNAQLLAQSEGSVKPARPAGATEDPDQLFASDRLMFGAQFAPWKSYKHPLYGDIEIGGFIKPSQRLPPPFLLEALCHRNAAFVVYHADQMPKIAWDEVKAERIGPDVFAVTASLTNSRSIPTRSRQASRHRIGLPDTLSLTGPSLTVAAGGPLLNADTGEVQPVEHNPATLRLEDGVRAGSPSRVRWFVRGKGEATVTYTSQKGGTLTRVVPLR
ncbi:MAG: M14 family metallopeptidase [Isosphaeraceae bacterium]